MKQILKINNYFSENFILKKSIVKNKITYKYYDRVAKMKTKNK